MQNKSSTPTLSAAQQAGLARLQAEMRAHGISRRDPVREVCGMLGDRWTTLVLLVLSIGTWRHAELQRVLGQLSAEGRISQRVLTLKLRALERNGFVQREATRDVPPRVSYTLTPLGAALADEARRLVEWVKSRQAEIESARRAYSSGD